MVLAAVFWNACLFELIAVWHRSYCILSQHQSRVPYNYGIATKSCCKVVQWFKSFSIPIADLWFWDLTERIEPGLTCCWSLLYSFILHSWADSLSSCHMWTWMTWQTEMVYYNRLRRGPKDTRCISVWISERDFIILMLEVIWCVHSKTDWLMDYAFFPVQETKCILL